LTLKDADFYDFFMLPSIFE